MACLRETPLDGRLGVVSCDETGCLHRRFPPGSGADVVEGTPEADCLLQLQLRAGDAEDSEYSPDPDHEDAGRDRPVRTIENVELLSISLDAEPGPYGGELHIGPAVGVPVDVNFNEFKFAKIRPNPIDRAGDALDDRFRLTKAHDRPEGQRRLDIRPVDDAPGLIYTSTMPESDLVRRLRERMEQLDLGDDGAISQFYHEWWGAADTGSMGQHAQLDPHEPEDTDRGLEDLAHGIIIDYGFEAFDRVWRKWQTIRADKGD